jgi:hypothetical protein
VYLSADVFLLLIFPLTATTSTIAGLPFLAAGATTVQVVTEVQLTEPDRIVPNLKVVPLPAELDLSIIKVVEAHVRPAQTTNLRDTRPGEGREREERPERLAGRRDRLLQLHPGEDRAAAGLSVLRSLR